MSQRLQKILNRQNKGVRLNSLSSGIQSVYHIEEQQISVSRSRGRNQQKLEPHGLYNMDISNKYGIIFCINQTTITAFYGEELKNQKQNTFQDQISGIKISSDETLIAIGFKQSKILKIYKLFELLDSLDHIKNVEQYQIPIQFSQIKWSPINSNQLLIQSNFEEKTTFLIQRDCQNTSLNQTELKNTFCSSFDLSGNIITANHIKEGVIQLQILDSMSLEDISSVDSFEFKFDFQEVYQFEEYEKEKWIVIGLRQNELDTDVNEVWIIPLTGSSSSQFKVHEPELNETIIAKYLEGQTDKIANSKDKQFRIFYFSQDRILIANSVIPQCTVVLIDFEKNCFLKLDESQDFQKVDKFSDLLRGINYCSFDLSIKSNENVDQNSFVNFSINSDHQFCQEAPHCFVTFDTKFNLEYHFICMDLVLDKEFENKTGGILPGYKKPTKPQPIVLPIYPNEQMNEHQIPNLELNPEQNLQNLDSQSQDNQISEQQTNIQHSKNPNLGAPPIEQNEESKMEIENDPNIDTTSQITGQQAQEQTGNQDEQRQPVEEQNQQQQIQNNQQSNSQHQENQSNLNEFQINQEQDQIQNQDQQQQQQQLLEQQSSNQLNNIDSSNIQQNEAVIQQFQNVEQQNSNDQQQIQDNQNMNQQEQIKEDEQVNQIPNERQTQQIIKNFSLNLLTDDLKNNLKEELANLNKYMDKCKNHPDFFQFYNKKRQGFLFDSKLLDDNQKKQFTFHKTDDYRLKLFNQFSQPSMFSSEFFEELDLFVFASQNMENKESQLHMMSSQDFKKVTDSISNLEQNYEQTMQNSIFNDLNEQESKSNQIITESNKQIQDQMKSFLIFSSTELNLISIHKIHSQFLALFFSSGYTILSIDSLAKDSQTLIQNRMRLNQFPFQIENPPKFDRSKMVFAINSISNDQYCIYKTFQAQFIFKCQNALDVGFSHNCDNRSFYFLHDKQTIHQLDENGNHLRQIKVVSDISNSECEDFKLYFGEFEENKFIIFFFSYDNNGKQDVNVYISFDGVEEKKGRNDQSIYTLKFKKQDIEKSSWEYLDNTKKNLQPLSTWFEYQKKRNFLPLIFTNARSFCQLQIYQQNQKAQIIEINCQTPNWVQGVQCVTGIIPTQFTFVDEPQLIWLNQNSVQDQDFKVYPILESILIFNGLFDTTRLLLLDEQGKLNITQEKLRQDHEQLKQNSQVFSAELYKKIKSGQYDEFDPKVINYIEKRIQEISQILHEKECLKLFFEDDLITETEQFLKDFENNDQIKSLFNKNEDEFRIQEFPQIEQFKDRINSYFEQKKQQEEQVKISLQEISQRIQDIQQSKNDGKFPLQHNQNNYGETMLLQQSSQQGNNQSNQTQQTNQLFQMNSQQNIFQFQNSVQNQSTIFADQGIQQQFSGNQNQLNQQLFQNNNSQQKKQSQPKKKR